MIRNDAEVGSGGLQQRTCRAAGGAGATGPKGAARPGALRASSPYTRSGITETTGASGRIALRR